MAVKHICIQNFKSIESLEIFPKRVNIFIGAPNSGKTNIIEALSFLSKGFHNHSKEMIRFEEASDLFTDFETNKIINIYSDNLSCTIQYERTDKGVLTNRFKIDYFGIKQESEQVNFLATYTMKYTGEIQYVEDVFLADFFHYIFKPQKEVRQDFEPFLEAPFGQNIPNILKTNPELRALVNGIFQEHGFQLFIRKAENKIVMARVLSDNSLLDFKFTSISTTLQRIIFMFLAIKSNKEKVLIFDELEANTYPFYVQEIAKEIAEDSSNQYFMTSHSSYLIQKLIDKTPVDELNIYHTKMKDFRTEVTLLNQAQIENFGKMGEDAMLNLENLVG